MRILRRPLDGTLVELKDTERTGLLALFDYGHFFFTLAKSEVERQGLLYIYLGDLMKGGRVYSEWFWNFRFNLLNKFLYGYMRNNMGTYREVTRH